MQGDSIADLLSRLRSGESLLAWHEFLDQYASVIFQAISHTIWDSERAADCFVHVCEQLRENNFRRLLRFDERVGSKFATWLRVVVRNLCIDWHRKQEGRGRLFQAIARLPLLHQEVYRLRYERGFSLDQVLVAVRGRFPDVSTQAVMAAENEVNASLGSRHHWLLAGRRVVEVASEEAGAPPDIADPRSGPEAELLSREQAGRLRKAVARLAPADRLLIQLRYEQGLTLGTIARFAGLPDAQTADRRIRSILQRLRSDMS